MAWSVTAGLHSLSVRLSVSKHNVPSSLLPPAVLTLKCVLHHHYFFIPTFLTLEFLLIAGAEQSTKCTGRKVDTWGLVRNPFSTFVPSAFSLVSPRPPLFFFDSQKLFWCGLLGCDVWKRPMFQNVFHVCEFMCLCAWNMCVKSLEVGPTIIACLRVCRPVCQPSNDYKLVVYYVSKYTTYWFTSLHFAYHLNWEITHTLHHKISCWSTLSFSHKLRLPVTHTHIHAPLLLLSQNMTFFPLPSA